MKTAIKAQEISFQYHDSKENTLSNISFEIFPGEALGILGPNGGGKTTLMKILSGVLTPKSGKITISDQLVNYSNFPFHKISYIPQTNLLNNSLPMSAREVLIYSSKAIKINNFAEKIDNIARKVGIQNKLDLQFKNMSGGEKQRVLLAKALLNDPQLLLLDEPTKGLDSLGQDQLLNLLKEIQKTLNTAVIIVDHNINQIIRHCDKVICLNKTSHWHDHKELLTKNVLENIYHCEFEHLLIHENESKEHEEHSNNHLYCDHGPLHSHQKETQRPKYILRSRK